MIGRFTSDPDDRRLTSEGPMTEQPERPAVGSDTDHRRHPRAAGPTLPLLPTAVVGSYPQPDWLIDRAALRAHMAPRVRVRDVWRLPEALLSEARDDATVVAIREQEWAGIDIITDGEIRRESYSNEFANALTGMAPDRHGEIVGRTGRRIPVPVVAGPISRPSPVGVAALRFLRAHTTRTIKATLPGPFTLAQQACNEYYPDVESLAYACADAVNAELQELFAAGADIVQLDEPWLEARPEEARRYGMRAIDRALAGATGTTAVHVCFGYAALVADKPGRYGVLEELADCAADQISIEAAQPRLDLAALAALGEKTIVLGVIDLGDTEVESAQCVADRIRQALDWVPPDRLIPAPDCGMKYLPRALARAKLEALAAGAALARVGL
jgi:5-methyltetrahydropteroyltriglutamate--homocysteine methyltransferase